MFRAEGAAPPAPGRLQGTRAPSGGSCSGSGTAGAPLCHRQESRVLWGTAISERRQLTSQGAGPAPVGRFRVQVPDLGHRAPGPPSLCPAACPAFPWCLDSDPTATGASFAPGARGVANHLRPEATLTPVGSRWCWVPAGLWPPPQTHPPLTSTRSQVVTLPGFVQILWKLPQVTCVNKHGSRQILGRQWPAWGRGCWLLV